MSRTRILVTTTILLVIIGLAFFFLPERTSVLDLGSEQTTEPSVATETEQKGNKGIPGDSNFSDNTFLEILPGDCTNECGSFTENTYERQYCQSVCGLTVAGSGISETSAAPYQESLERRESAIKNQDLGACAEITDTNLRKSCEVRVTEDLLE